MKIIINILKFIIMVILTVCLLFVGIKNVVTSTMLNKTYILQKLDETNFYSETYKIVESNFENYISQSGLDEEVLENICTEDKVKKDINIIISNIYDGTNEEIDTTEIAEKLNSNIDKQNVRTSKNSSAIDEFVNHICESYRDSIINTKYDKTINDLYEKILRGLEKVNKIVITISIIDIVLLVALNIKNISKILANFAETTFATSLLQFVFIIIIKAKVDISNIKAFNDAFSETIVAIIKNILNQINILGIVMLFISIIFTVIYEIIVYHRAVKKELENREGRRWKN